MTHAQIGDHLALVNALLNGTSAALVVSGRFAIARKRSQVHRRLMIGAFATSSAFLVSYLVRVALTGRHDDPHHGAIHLFYLAILMSHMVLAMAVVPLVLFTLRLAYKGRFARHKKLAKVTFPVWLYVSVTGVIVYVVLYHLPA